VSLPSPGEKKAHATFIMLLNTLPFVMFRSAAEIILPNSSPRNGSSSQLLLLQIIQHHSITQFCTEPYWNWTNNLVSRLNTLEV